MSGFQRPIQNAVIHLRLCVLQKLLTTISRYWKTHYWKIQLSSQLMNDTRTIKIKNFEDINFQGPTFNEILENL